MKKLFLSPILFLMITSAMAQKPEEGDMGVTFGIEGLATVDVTSMFGGLSTVMFRYYLKDDLALRSRINVNWSQNTSEQSDTTGFSNKVVTKGHYVNINVGLQKDFGNVKRLEPYVTGELSVTAAKTGISETTNIISPEYMVVTNVDPGGTFGVGLVSNVGFNYFPTERLSFGAELGYGLTFNFANEGTTTVTTTVSGTTTVETSSTPKSHSFSLGGTGGLGVITISYFFGAPWHNDSSR